MTADFLHGTVSPDMPEDVQSNLEAIFREMFKNWSKSYGKWHKQKTSRLIIETRDKKCPHLERTGLACMSVNIFAREK